jgi:hypothetical protein
MRQTEEKRGKGRIEESREKRREVTEAKREEERIHSFRTSQPYQHKV